MEQILTFDEIKKCVLGAERVWEENGTLRMCRFTEAEQETYRRNPDFFQKTFSSSNMRISFFTDAEKLLMAYETVKGSSRNFAFLDVKVDDILVAHSGTEDINSCSEYVLEVRLPGKKCRVEIFLPPLAGVVLRELRLENGAFLGEAARQKLIISYGDSITQGYDARYPVCSYTALLAESLQAELVNKAIGGDIFNPALAAAGKCLQKPDLITTAYGTNDWSKSPSREELLNNCEGFFSGIRKCYTDTPIVAILPIWRKDNDRTPPSGNFFEVRNEIRKIAEKFTNIYTIDGLLLTPHLPDFFSDKYLHPNDSGFMLMGQNLISEIRKCLPNLWQEME